MDLSGVRRPYERGGLRKSDLEPEPMLQFERWLNEAVAAELLEPTAMTLATAEPSGRVSARMVLLKGYGPDGFLFFSNFESRKAEDLAANPHAALVFWWDRLERQLRVEGSVERTSREVSERYFSSRPRGSQLGAWASPQSRVLASREELLALTRQVEDRFAGVEIPLPDHWGGFLLRPAAMEIWQGRPDRLHDRFRYSREGAGWRLERLAP